MVQMSSQLGGPYETLKGRLGVTLKSSNEEEAGEPFSIGCPLSVVPGPRSRHLRPADRDIPVSVVRPPWSLSPLSCGNTPWFG
jgi:hypothetical protein